MVFEYADDRAWWQAGPVPIAMTAFWRLPSWAIYSRITGVTRQPGPRARDTEHRCDDARRILDGRLADDQFDTGAYRRLRDELSSGGGCRPAGSGPLPMTAAGAVMA